MLNIDLDNIYLVIFEIKNKTAQHHYVVLFQELTYTLQ